MPTIQGCSVEALGVMRYRALAAPDFVRRYFPVNPDPERLRLAPVLTFNRKDELQARFLRELTGAAIAPPTHFIPSTLSFLAAAQRGLGWAMIPEGFAGTAPGVRELVDIAPGRWLDVPLYWHRWRFASPVLDALTRAVRQAAARSLRSESLGR